MMQTVLTVTAVILSLAAAGAIVRIARGPSLLDRVLASDVLLAIFGRPCASTWPSTGTSTT